MKSFDNRPPENSLLLIHDIKHNYYFGGIYKNGHIEVIEHDNITGKYVITDLQEMEYETISDNQNRTEP